MKNILNDLNSFQTEKDDKKIFIIDNENKKHFGEIEFEFEINGEEFVAYTLDENEEMLYIMKYDELGELTNPLDDEWPLIEEVIESFKNEKEEK